MKRLFDLIRSRLRLFVLGWAVLMLVVLGARLGQGPIRVDAMRPIIASRIEARLPHTRVTIGHLDLVWFGDTGAIGFRFHDLMITDRQHRIIARAGTMETALAADGLLVMQLAPARLTADDFFVAASVSDEGRYELGYNASGKPTPDLGLARYLADLTGPQRLGRPVSYARDVSLRNGELRLMQQGASLDWTAKVATVDYSKRHGRLAAHVDLAVTSAGGTGLLKAAAEGSVGLKEATISTDVGNLVPAQVFPSVGVTRYLSVVDAPVSGLARVDYSARQGFKGSWIDLGAGQGYIVIAGHRQDFSGARVKATYDSATRTALFQTMRVTSRLVDTDLSGRLVIRPGDEKAHRDLSLDFDFSGPRVTGALADDFSPQTLLNAHFRGAYIPLQHRLRIDSGSGVINGAALQTQGALYTDDKGQLGATLTATLKGSSSKAEIFAFWPEDLAPNTRSGLIERIRTGVFSNANFVLAAPPGHFAKDQMQDQDLRLDFDFRDAEIAIEDRMLPASALAGHGILLGNSFHMTANAGRLGKVALDKGTIDITDFHNPNTGVKIAIDAHGDIADVIEAVDPLASGELAKHGLNRQRLSGAAQGHVDISLPTTGPVNEHTMQVTFTGKVNNAAFSQVALGWDLTGGETAMSGDMRANTLDVIGTGQVGPFNGNIGYHTQFDPKTQTVDFKGLFNAAQFGGSPRVLVPVTGKMLLNGHNGQGTVDAAIFKGDVAWSGDGSGDGRPQQVTITGNILRDGMEQQGLPIFEHLPPQLPTRISLLRSGDIWSGEFDADPLSGDVAYVQGTRPRLVYQTKITPERARRIGYGALPMFNTPRQLTVNVALDSQSKEALLKLDTMTAVLGWAEVPGTDEVRRRLSMTVRPQDWATLGLPANFFHPKADVPVTALWQQDEHQLTGQVKLLDQTIDFDMPIHPYSTVTEPPPLVVPGKVVPYTLQVRGDVTPHMLDVLGYTQSPVRVTGPVGLVFSLYDLPGQPAAVLNLDAARAELGVERTEWTKPVGEAAQLAVAFDDPGDGSRGVNLSRIVGSGDRVQVDGRASFDSNGKLVFADFSKVWLKDFMDVSFQDYVLAEHNESVISISGQQLDLRPWLEASNGSSPDALATAIRAGEDQAAQAQAGKGQPTHLVVNLARLQTSAAGAFGNIRLDVNWDGSNGVEGVGSGQTMDGSAMTLSVRNKGNYSLFSLQTSDLGDVIRTFSGVPNVHGGDAVIAGAYRDGQTDAQVKGGDIRVQQIPALAQLLTLASLQGLSDTLAGDGILFSDFDFPIRYRGHELFIRNGYAKGDALGINIWGTTDLDAKTMNFNGSLIPAYSINALFGDVKSNGLGLVGLKYDLKGTYKTPAVDVNPLSLILPGFIKAALDSERKDAIAPLDLPKNYKDELDDMRPKKLKKQKDGDES